MSSRTPGKLAVLGARHRSTAPFFLLTFLRHRISATRHVILAAPRHILGKKIRFIKKLRHSRIFQKILPHNFLLNVPVSCLLSHVSCLSYGLSHVYFLLSHVSCLSHLRSPVSYVFCLSRLLSLTPPVSHVSCLSRLLSHVHSSALCPTMLNCYELKQTTCTSSSIVMTHTTAKSILTFIT